MKRLFMTSLAMLLLTGCADLQMIKNAALSELQSDAISVEMAAYRQTAVIAEPEEAAKPVLAKRQAEGLITLAMGPKMNQHSVSSQKGLWER